MDHRPMRGNWNEIARGPQYSYRRHGENRPAFVLGNDIEMVPLIKFYLSRLRDYILEVLHRL